jgi:hypothetical protein
MKWNNLLNILFRKKKDKESEYCFGLILKEEEGKGLILKVDQREKKITNVDEKKFIFSNSWEKLAEDVDEVLFELEESNKIRVEKTIFFLYSHLVDQKTSQIRQPYLNKTKRLLKELELKPLGYVEHHEALSVYISKKEEAPLTSIIIELDKSSISLFIYKAGEVVFSDLTARTEDLIVDLENIFNKIKREIILPSRIIIYNSSDLEEEANKIISHKWKENLFIQIPRVEIINYEQLKEALIFSFSQQIFQDEKTKVSEEKKEVMGFMIGKDVKENKEELVTSNFPIKPEKQLRIHYLLLAGFILTFCSIFCLLYFYHNASIILYFQGKKIDKEINFDRNQLLIKKIAETVEKEKSANTSGKKIIGEKAKGEVTIYNSTTEEKEFKKETILETGKGLKFLLDDDAKVASASQNLTDEGNLLTVTGKNKAKITAVEIGTSGNIDKNEKLKIGSFSSNLFFAIAADSLKGGSQEEIQTVSKEDMEKLKKAITEEIKKQTSSLIKDKIKDDQIIERLTKVEIGNERFSKELGEEGKTLSLKVDAKVTFYTFNRNEIKQAILKILKDSIESNYELPKENINYTLKDVEEEDQKITLIVGVSAKTVAKKDKNQLIGQLIGRRLGELENIVKKKLGAGGYEIKIKTEIPFLKSRLPFFEKNINLRIESL